MRIEKDQFFLSGIKSNFLFHMNRGQGHFVSYLQNRIQWHWYPRFGVVSYFPLHVDIETSTCCDMRCPMCYRRTEQFAKRVKQQFMNDTLFIKIINECSRNRLFSVRLSLRGEPFIHPDIFNFIELAKKTGIKEVSSLTNGLFLTPEKFERLVKIGFDWLTISFDGLGSTYESVRNPAKFDEALQKIKIYSQIKKKYGSSKPVIKIQSIWPAIKDNVEDFYQILLPYVDQIAFNPSIDFLREEDDRNIEYDKDYFCPYLYQRLVIGVDGRVLLCASDEYGDCVIGDVHKESLYDIWHGDRLNKARDWFKGKIKKWWEIDPCKRCCYPRKRARIKDVAIKGRMIKAARYISRSNNSYQEKEYA